jgi:hypothetical protein
MKENKKIEIENEVISKSNSPMKWIIMLLASLALVKIYIFNINNKKEN